jgi:hypothetical protein
MLFALAIHRRGALADGVQAHATTNGLLALYACLKGIGRCGLNDRSRQRLEAA